VGMQSPSPVPLGNVPARCKGEHRGWYSASLTSQQACQHARQECSPHRRASTPVREVRCGLSRIRQPPRITSLPPNQRVLVVDTQGSGGAGIQGRWWRVPRGWWRAGAVSPEAAAWVGKTQAPSPMHPSGITGNCSDQSSTPWVVSYLWSRGMGPLSVSSSQKP
jgi:hypothetical protein